MIRFRSILNGDIRTKWRREYFDAGYGSFVPFGSLLAVSPVVQADFATLTPYTTPAWISNAGTTGNRMYYDSTGKLTWAPANLIPTSATLTTQTITNGVTTGGTYILSAELAVGASVVLSGGSTLTLNTSSSSVGGRYYIKTAALTLNTLTLTVSGAVTNAQLERVTYQTTPSTLINTSGAQVFLLRYDYNPATLAARGILIEESRANNCVNSNPLSNSLASNMTVATGQSAPDGTTNGILLTTTSTANASIRQGTSQPTSSTSTISIYAKKGSQKWVYILNFAANPVSRTWFDVDAGVVGTVGAGSATITSVGNGWYRCTWTAPTLATITTNVIDIGISNANGVLTCGNGDTLSAFGRQSETGAFATSLVPTAGAAVTRAADIIALSDSALTTAGAATGSAIVQTSQWINSTAAARDLLSTSLSRRLLYSNSSNTAISTTDGTTSLPATIGSSQTFTANAVRSGVAWNTFGRSIVANNGVLTTDAVALGTGVPVNIGGYASTTTFDGWVISMALYDKRLTDATLAQKSVVNAVY